MKTLTLLTLIAIFATGAHAQDSKYDNAMSAALGKMSSANTPQETKDLSNQFDRLSMMNPDSLWPIYYSALVLINSNWQLQEAQAKDDILDAALKLIDSAEKLSPNNSEVETLRGYALMAKMVVDPQSRGQGYSPRIMNSFGKALKLDPSNPRTYAMMARMEMGSAQFFGTSLDGACDKAYHAVSLFESEKPQGFSPRWGRQTAEEVLKACNTEK